MRTRKTPPPPNSPEPHDGEIADTPDLFAEMHAKFEAQQRSLDQFYDRAKEEAREQLQQSVKDMFAEFEQRLVQKDQEVAVLEKKVETVLDEHHAMQEEIKQLKDRLESSQTCSTSQAGYGDGPVGSSPQQSSPPGQWAEVASRVARLTDCKMQDMDLADQEARKNKELNAVFRNLEQVEGETSESLKDQVDELLLDQLETTVACVSAKRLQKARNGTALGIVVVQFAKKQDKVAVFKARGKLAGTKVGLDEDLTHLQQKRKNAAWSDFKDSKGIKTQWRAEKLFVKKGEHCVEHKVLSL
ncbi:hypothetical protein ABBQ38_006464 [Trebouxia sp. C0009 RCD-2024]